MGSQYIPLGSLSPSVITGTDFGVTDYLSTRTRYVHVYNGGSLPLQIISVSTDQSSSFNITGAATVSDQNAILLRIRCSIRDHNSGLLRQTELPSRIWRIASARITLSLPWSATTPFVRRTRSQLRQQPSVCIHQACGACMWTEPLWSLKFSRRSSLGSRRLPDTTACSSKPSSCVPAIQELSCAQPARRVGPLRLCSSRQP